MTTVTITDPAYGGIADLQWAFGPLFTIAVSSNILTASPGVFSSSDVGKTISVGTAGAAGPGGGTPLTATIASYTSSTTISLSTNAGNALSSSPVAVSWGTDNSAAFTAFNSSQQGLSGTILQIPSPGCLIVSGNQSLFGGIKSLTVNGIGGNAALGGGTWGIGSSAQQQFGNNTAQIQDCVAGQTVLQLTAASLSAGDIANIPVNQIALMTGLDLQGPFAFPTNHQFFDYVFVTATSSATNTITLASSTPLTHDYKSTWPRYGAESLEPDPGGPATIYALNAGFDYTLVMNDVTLVYEAEMNAGAKSITLNNCPFKGTFGPFPSQTISWTMNNSGSSNGNMEVDKYISNLTINNSSLSLINIQSASITNLNMDTTSLGFYLLGTACNNTIANCNFANMRTGPNTFGIATGFLNMRNTNVTTWDTGIYNDRGANLSGVDHTYAMSGGTIKSPSATQTGLSSDGSGNNRLLVADTSIFVNGNNYNVLTASSTGGFIINGAYVFTIHSPTEIDIPLTFLSSLTFASGVVGQRLPIPWAVPTGFCRFGTGQFFKILNVRQDTNYTYVDTNFFDNGGTWPQYWDGVPGTILSIAPHPATISNFTGMTGDGIAVGLNDGPGNVPLYSWSKHIYTQAACTNVSQEAFPMWGNLVEISINVTHAYAGAGALQWHITELVGDRWDVTISNEHTVVSYHASVNAKAAGERIIRLSGNSGAIDALDVLIPIPDSARTWFLGPAAFGGSQYSADVSATDPAVSVTFSFTTDQEITGSSAADIVDSVRSLEYQYGIYRSRPMRIPQV